jgi:nucleotide-binding universal stress UspA family protein
MNHSETGVPASQPTDRGRSIERLLFVADATVADVEELPPAVRAVIDAATDVYVVTPTLPGRLAWLADDVDRFRHVADERLDTVLGHMHSIGAHASGLAGRGSVPLVIADAVADFEPDHVLIALRSAEHANWQERRLIEHIEERFGLPVTTYAVDRRGHTPAAGGPLLICYDGSEEAAHAIERAGALFAGRHALVVTVWQPPSHIGGLARSGATSNADAFAEADRSVAEHAGRVADTGVQIANEAGLHAEPAAEKAAGAVWTTILEIADRHDAATIVMGSRALRRRRSMQWGSVSSDVVRHAARPALVIPGRAAPNRLRAGVPGRVA